jgi:hypothetical protein
MTQFRCRALKIAQSGGVGNHARDSSVWGERTAAALIGAVHLTSLRLAFPHLPAAGGKLPDTRWKFSDRAK